MEVSASSKQSAHLFLHPSDFKFMEEDFALKLSLSEIEQQKEGMKTEKQDVFRQGEELEEKSDDDEEEENEDEEDFSFSFSTNQDGSPISADDVFQNGQIRPVFPLFNRDLLLSSSSANPPLKKLYMEENTFVASSSSSSSSSAASNSNAAEQNEPEGPYCAWRKDANNEAKASDGLGKKSNSTGFSRLWRFKDFVHLRSSSDGKDAFVFLNNNNNNASKDVKNNNNVSKDDKGDSVEKKLEKGEKAKVVTKKKSKGKTTSLAAHYERNYGAVKGQDAKRRSSYLPYRVGFFTNVNGLTRNVHPF